MKTPNKSVMALDDEARAKLNADADNACSRAFGRLSGKEIGEQLRAIAEHWEGADKG